MLKEKELIYPLTQVAIDILLALTGQELHGYAIMKEVETTTGTKILTGTLYRTLTKLSQQGLVEETDRPSEEDDERRKYYQITMLGQETLSAELKRMNNVLRTAQRKRLLPQAGLLLA